MKTKQINLRIPEDELSAWKANAKGMSLTDWIRQRCNQTSTKEELDQSQLERWTAMANAAGMSLNDWIASITPIEHPPPSHDELARTVRDISITTPVKAQMPTTVTPKGEPVEPKPMLRARMCPGCGFKLFNGEKCKRCKLTPVTD